MTIAQTILSQLGNNKFIAMTGAKNFVNTSTGLQFDVKGKKMIITLLADDTYKVEMGKLNKKTLEFVYDKKYYSEFYAEQLQEIFTSMTGLYTNL